MTLILLGLALWWAAHLFKRLAPGARAKMGDPGKGLVAVALLASIACMVFGYRGSSGDTLWAFGPWAVHLNNLLMLIAVVLFGMSSSKGRAGSWLRHPMLAGFFVWAVAHLLVNGDVPSVILFGGLAAWAPVQIALINAAEGPWVRPAATDPKGDVKLVVISLVVFTVIAVIHGWIGPWPFGGGA